MLELHDFKSMTEIEINNVLKNIKLSDKLHLCTEGKRMRQSENSSRFGYLNNAVNAGICRNGKLAGDKNGTEDIGEGF